MAHSPLLGIDRVPAHARGRDSLELGPSDSSDSGSDVAGLDWLDDADPREPLDVAVAEVRQHPDTTNETLGMSDTDASGTGERRSAGADDGGREAADIGPDRVIDLADARTLAVDDSDEDPIAVMLAEAAIGPPEDDEDIDVDDPDAEVVPEDEDDDPVGNRATEPDVERPVPSPGREPDLRARSSYADVAAYAQPTLVHPGPYRRQRA